MPPKLCVSPISLPQGGRSAHTAAALSNTSHVCSLFYLTTSVTHISTASAVPQELQLHTVPTHSCHPLSCSTNNPQQSGSSLALQILHALSVSSVQPSPGASSTRSAGGLLSLLVPWKGSCFPVNDHSPWVGDRPPSMALVSWWSLMRKEGNLFCFNFSHTGRLEARSAGSWDKHVLQLYGPQQLTLKHSGL